MTTKWERYRDVLSREVGLFLLEVWQPHGAADAAWLWQVNVFCAEVACGSCATEADAKRRAEEGAEHAARRVLEDLGKEGSK